MAAFVHTALAWEKGGGGRGGAPSLEEKERGPLAVIGLHMLLMEEKKEKEQLF